jgi:hypothetical protein
MEAKLPNKQEVIREALAILEKHMEPSKIALLVSMLPIGEGNYLAIREQLFAGETVETLVEKVIAYQESKIKNGSNKPDLPE